MLNNLENEKKGLIYASFTAILWGFLAVFLKFSLIDFDSVTVVWFRFLFAFILLVSITFFKKKENLLILKKPPILLIIAGIALGFNYVLFLQGLKYTNPSITNIIIQIGPVLLAAVGIIFYKEKVNIKQILGFVFVIVGFSIFYYNQITNGEGLYKDLSYGVFLIVLAAISWVVYASFQKKLNQKIEPQSLNLIIYLVPALMFTPFVNYSSFLNLNIQSFLVLVFLGANTLLAYGFIGEAFKYAPANKVSIIITLNPIITLIAMAILDTFNFNWLGKEMTSFLGYVGAILVISGAILAIVKGR